MPVSPQIIGVYIKLVRALLAITWERFPISLFINVVLIVKVRNVMEVQKLTPFGKRKYYSLNKISRFLPSRPVTVTGCESMMVIMLALEVAILFM